MALPGGEAAEVVARRPVLPIPMVLVARWEPAALHIDQPGMLTRRRDDEVETLERPIGHDAAPRFIDRNVRQPASTQERLERGFVMVVAVHEKLLAVSY